MTEVLGPYHALFDFFLLNLGYALSQQVVLRAGVFSVATAAFAALGAYCSAILVLRYGASEGTALTASLCLGLIVGLALSLPLARLRGIYQAIATFAFVQIVVALLLYAENLTGGALGINGIPRLVGTWHLAIIVCVVLYFIYTIGNSGIGRAFDAIRQDQSVGAMLGISIRKFHVLAFAISGAIGGLFGGLNSLLVYAIEPAMFGFSFMATVLTFIVLGGRGSIWGALIGTAVLTTLPEVARPFSENRDMAQGILMIVMISCLPNGIYDSVLLKVRQHLAARRERNAQEKKNAIASA